MIKKLKRKVKKTFKKIKKKFNKKIRKIKRRIKRINNKLFNKNIKIIKLSKNAAPVDLFSKINALKDQENFSDDYYTKIKNMALEFKKRYYNKMKTKHTDTELLQLFVEYLYTFNHFDYCIKSYFLFGLFSKEISYSEAFFTKKYRKAVNKSFAVNIYYKYFNDRVLFYKTFDKYIKRDWLYIQASTIDEYKSFAEKHHVFHAKKVLTDSQNNVSVMKYYNNPITQFTICYQNNFIVEEIVANTYGTNDEDSISYTVCVITSIKTDSSPTILSKADNEIDILSAGIKIEQKEIDSKNINFKIAALLDIKTGGIIENTDSKFPDSSKFPPDFQMPQWNEIVKLSKEAAKVIPQAELVAWSIAVKSNGEPELIEGNTFS